MKLALPVLVLLALAAPSAAAGAGVPADVWATINACDSARFPDRVGVRAALPGDGTGKRMYARFRLQFYSSAESSWQPVANGNSPKRYIGSARRDRQAGWTFHVNPPAQGGSFLLRGVADLEWKKKAYRIKRVRVKRRGRTVVRRKRVFRRWVTHRRSTQVSRAGLSGVRGGDGLSLSTCTLR